MSVKLKHFHFFDVLFSLIKLFIAYILFILRKKENKNIILLGGNMGRKYEDNAAVFHKYLTNNIKENISVYWMYDKKFFNPDGKGILNPVPLGSIKNYYLFFNADYVIFSHSLSLDIAPFINKFLFLNNKVIKIHVSHGIEGFKKLLLNKKMSNLLKEIDYFNCVSEYEKKIKEEKWGVPTSKLIVTGMPRLDNLNLNEKKQKMENIMFFPTWREWIINEDFHGFSKTKYYISIIQLIKDESFISLLKRNDITLKIVLHPFFNKFSNHFKREVISITDIKNRVELFESDNLSIQKEIVKSDLLITDYSSIAWDFYYLNKPIIFYQFDQEEYIKRRGSYLDLNKDLFGYKALNSLEVIKYLNKILLTGENYNKKYNEIRKYFDYLDKNNCKRLYEKIKSLN
jgi:CDP-glycerol glycerophosphotransferase (TagB/SpsB family)